MRVVLSTWGRFHFFHLARQLVKRDCLERIFSTYPKFKLKNEFGIPPDRIQTDSLIETLVMGKNRLGLLPSKRLDESLTVAKVLLHDRYLLDKLESIPSCDAFVALSGSGFAAGPQVQARGGRYICDRGSTHIAYGDDLLSDEFARYGATFRRTHPRHIERELHEYEVSDAVVVPSNFAKRSFVERGILESKIHVIPYGVELSRFSRRAPPPEREFVMLYVGGIRFRKGIPYLLEAFRAIKHPRKKLVLVGGVMDEIKDYLAGSDLTGVEFKGIVPNAELSETFSRAHVMVLPSVEEGLALVQAEALACGCPVIATPNTGSEDLFTHGREGFIVAPRSPSAIADAVGQLLDTPGLREQMSDAAIAATRHMGGWDRYGERYSDLLVKLTGQSIAPPGS